MGGVEQKSKAKRKEKENYLLGSKNKVWLGRVGIGTGSPKF